MTFFYIKEALSQSGSESDHKAVEHLTDCIVKLEELYPPDDAAHKQMLAVTLILKDELNLSAEPIAGYLLNVLLNKGVFERSDYRKRFGETIFQITEGLNSIHALDAKQTPVQTELFIKLILTLSEDIRSILIALAEHLYTIRHVQELPTTSQAKVMQLSGLLYTPIAHRLGLYTIKTELEDHTMRYHEPALYQDIESHLSTVRTGLDQFISRFIAPIDAQLKMTGICYEIKGRVKTIPSIRRKMDAQQVGLEKVYDLFAVRVVCDSSPDKEKEDCWNIYSVVTDLYTPNAKRLRDWISYPKSNGYESLHTTVIGPEGRWVEVQIRSRRMDEVAEKGLAAHWNYKERKKKGQQETDWFSKVREYIEIPKEIAGQAASADKRLLYSDELFIFTPKGDLKKIKRGYTVLDFAFEIHTDIGSTCTGAMVNGKIAPLKHELQNGDTVRVNTSKSQKPNPEWLKIAKNPRVLTRIKNALKSDDHKDAEYGKEMLLHKLKQLGLENEQEALDRLVRHFKCNSHLELYQLVGDGTLDIRSVKQALMQPAEQDSAGEKNTSLPERISGVVSGRVDQLIIDNKTDAMHYALARCCQPIPGDKIFAFISVTQGVKIHKTSCPNARDLITRYPYRIMSAVWRNSEQQGAFVASLIIEGKDSGQPLHDVSSFFSHELKAQVRAIQILSQEKGKFRVKVGLFVTSTHHLDQVVARILKQDQFRHVQRVT